MSTPSVSDFRSEKPCLICEKLFIARRDHADSGFALFCSRACMGKHRSQTSRVDLVCEQCGAVNSRPRSQANRGKHSYCSYRCRGLAQGKMMVTIPCAYCQEDFRAYPSLIEKGKKFCSRRCQGRHQSEHNVWDRLIKNAVRLPSGCLVRSQRISSSGYSYINWRGKHIGAHVLAYMHEHGEDSIPKGWDVCHTCPGEDNRACFEITHLSVKSHAGNIQEAVQRGLMARKLTEDQVREIRRLYDAGGLTLAKLAAMFNVTDITIHSIGKRRTWTWLPD